MMSWVPWPEAIKKRATRYLLQRYLGHYLEQKLGLDQLSVDLYSGTGSIKDILLDVDVSLRLLEYISHSPLPSQQGLNSLGKQYNLPVEFVDGFIGEISVNVPWASLLRENTQVDISGLRLTIQPKQREEFGKGLFDALQNSLPFQRPCSTRCGAR